MGDFDRRFVPAERVVARQAHDVHVLLDLTSGSYYSLDGVGARAWQLCDGRHSLDAVIAVIADEFDAPVQVIRTDVGELVDELVHEGLLVEVP